MAVPEPKLRELFSKALECQSAKEQSAYLEQVCQGDAELRVQVEELLQAHQEASRFLQEPSESPIATVDQPSASEGPGSVIGPYKLLEQIGEGGFGVVYMAEQTQPVRRKVALKILKPGMDTRQVVARFEAERQALALMDHPHIAHVFDGGTTSGEPGGVSAGRPYFVMELVKGVPITEFCDQNHLTPQQRLELFIPVCQAVQHAHQKGIIHRDLKPTNVLVSRHDTTPIVKVIDFGVAKALGQELTDKTMFTGIAQMIGTPMYMSPEQAGMSDLDVDTRSDIYSLGVLLYELLTGTTPFDKNRLRTAAYDEIRRIIREEEPPKPSTRISTMGRSGLPSRTSPPRQAGPTIAPETTNLATIAAQRRSDPKRLSQLFRGELDWIVMKALEKDRNRRYETANSLALDLQRYLHDEPVLACPPSATYRLYKFARRNKGMVVTVMLVLTVLIGGIIGTSVGLVQAKNAEGQALKDRDEKAKALKEAERQAAIATGVSQFLRKDLLEMAGADAQFSNDLPPDPDVKLRTLLDRAERRVGERFRDQPEVEAAIRETLANAFAGVGEPARAAEQYAKVRDYQETTLGADHPDTLMSQLSFASTISNLGRRDEALQLDEKVFRLLKDKLGEDDHRTLTAMSNLAVAYMNVGRSAEALVLFQEAHRRMSSTLGPDDPETLSCLGDLALVSLNEGPKSVTLLEEVFRLKKEKLGRNHPETLATAYWLANAYLIRGRLAEGISLSEETLKLAKEVHGPDHPVTASSMRLLGKTLVSADRVSEALPLLEEALRLIRAKHGPKHSMTLDSLHCLARAFIAAKQPEKAEALIRESLAILEQDQPNGRRTLVTKLSLATFLVSQKKYAEAEPMLRQAYEGLQQADVKPLDPNAYLTRALEQLTLLYDGWGKKEEATKWRKKLESHREESKRIDQDSNAKPK